MSRTIEPDEARRLVCERAMSLRRRERVPLADALGRTLAEDLACSTPWPVTDRSAMDGFALRGGIAAGAVLRVAGESLAGRPFTRSLGESEAVRIMTGAVVPIGADAVARVEDTSGFAGLDGDPSRVRIEVPIGRGANVRARGSELVAGQRVLSAGDVVRAAEVGVLAVLGVTEVPVAARPRVAIVSTGDEVVEASREPAPHQVRDSNSWALAAQCVESGASPQRLGIAPDEAGALRAMLAQGLDADVLLTIGGVSAGTHDLVHATLAELGVQTVFHGVKLKPGKPLFFGVRETGARRCAVFGLPGNPASAFTTFDLFVAPLLRGLLGRGTGGPPVTARLRGRSPRANPRTLAIPARLRTGSDGALHAVLEEVRTSGDPFALVAGDAHAIVPAETAPVDGTVVTVVPYAATRGVGGA